MEEKNPLDILNDFKSGKLTGSAAIDKLFLLIQESQDDTIKIHSLEILVKNFLFTAEKVIKKIIQTEESPSCLFELYQYLASEGEKAKKLRQFMELTIGREFLKKYDLIPKEAMALELIGCGMVWQNPDYHTPPSQWRRRPSQWTDIYTHKSKNGIVIQIWIAYRFNEIDSKYFQLLSGLERLYLYDCRLTDYSFLTDLRHLTVSGGDVPQISKIDEIIGLENLVKLRELNLTYNEISEIKNLNNLLNLRKLDLSKNNIEEIKGLQTLIRLENLNLEFNNIKEIKGLEKIANLKVLNLAENYKIDEIKGFENLTNLESLNLGCNYLINEIKGLNTLINLKKLDLSMNHYMEIDPIHYIIGIKGLDNLVNLEELYLSGNQISKMKGIDRLRNIRILDLSHNQITDFKEIENLANLEKLYITDNPIPRKNIKEFLESHNINIIF